jgi:hypothetical protein
LLGSKKIQPPMIEVGGHIGGDAYVTTAALSVCDLNRRSVTPVSAPYERCCGTAPPSLGSAPKSGVFTK